MFRLVKTIDCFRMKEATMNKITLNYKLVNEDGIKSIEIPINEYFDLDEGEIPHINSVPEFMQPYDYVPNDVSEIIYLTINVEINGDTRQIKQSFWNNGKKFIIEVIQKGKINYKELIISITTDENKKLYEVIRFGFEKDFIVPILHTYFEENSAGEEETINVELEPFNTIIKEIIADKQKNGLW